MGGSAGCRIAGAAAAGSLGGKGGSWRRKGSTAVVGAEDCVSATIKMFPLSMMSPTMARGLTIAPTEPHPTRHPLTVVIVRKCSYV